MRKTTLARQGRVPRATGDLDIWVRPTPDNADRIVRALAAFGVPLSDLSVEDLTRTDTVSQLGQPPARIDILSGITGVSFATWRFSTKSRTSIAEPRTGAAQRRSSE